MSVGSKSSSTQLFRLMLYRRALHPELFDLRNRRQHRHGEYEVEAWIAPGGHVIRFSVDGQVYSEAVLESGDHLPETGLVYALPCLGEKDYELEPAGRIGYVTTVQTESLTDNLFQATFKEMAEFGQETGALFHEWTDEEGRTNLSLLDTQKYMREFHVQSYHLTGQGGTVLRTQSIFEVV